MTSRTLYREWVDSHVVNTVSPGYIATDMVKAIRQDVLDKIVAGIPVKRLGTPDDLASMVAWLAS